MSFRKEGGHNSSFPVNLGRVSRGSTAIKKELSNERGYEEIQCTCGEWMFVETEEEHDGAETEDICFEVKPLTIQPPCHSCPTDAIQGEDNCSMHSKGTSFGGD